MRVDLRTKSDDKPHGCDPSVVQRRSCNTRTFARANSGVGHPRTPLAHCGLGTRYEHAVRGRERDTSVRARRDLAGQLAYDALADGVDVGFVCVPVSVRRVALHHREHPGVGDGQAVDVPDAAFASRAPSRSRSRSWAVVALGKALRMPKSPSPRTWRIVSMIHGVHWAPAARPSARQLPMRTASRAEITVLRPVGGVSLRVAQLAHRDQAADRWPWHRRSSPRRDSAAASSPSRIIAWISARSASGGVSPCSAARRR